MERDVRGRDVSVEGHGEDGREWHYYAKVRDWDCILGTKHVHFTLITHCGKMDW